MIPGTIGRYLVGGADVHVEAVRKYRMAGPDGVVAVPGELANVTSRAPSRPTGPQLPAGCPGRRGGPGFTGTITAALTMAVLSTALLLRLAPQPWALLGLLPLWRAFRLAHHAY